MKQIEITTDTRDHFGLRKVISTSNDGTSWNSRLYVNDGETATLVRAKHKTEAEVREWAAKVLA